MPDFVHLHNHMEGSLADATLRSKKAAVRAKELGMNAIALTDHGYMYSVIDFYKNCMSAGIKPIIGMETYVAPRFNTMREFGIDNANYHLVLLCENNTGYHNLMQIASDAATDGVYFKPRTDKHKLRKYHEGLIALSACFLPGTKVKTSESWKNIEDITDKDYVLTDNGTYQKVISPTTRFYKGEICEVKSCGAIFDIKCTASHKFLTMKNPRKVPEYKISGLQHDDDLRNKLLLEFSDARNGELTRFDERLARNLSAFNQPEWAEAKNLTSEDLLLTPIDMSVESIEEIDISEYNISKFKRKQVSEKILVDQEFLEILGLYAAEGSVDSNRLTGVNFCLNIGMTHYANKIAEWAERYTDSPVLPKYRPGNQRIDIDISRKTLALAFSDWLGMGCCNKKVPYFVKKLSPEKQMHFVKGAFLGDGYYQRRKDARNLDWLSKRIIYCSTSKQLIFDIVNILQRNQINPNVICIPAHVDSKGLKHKESYNIEINGKIAEDLIQFIWEDKPFVNNYRNKRIKDVVINIGGTNYVRSPLKKIAMLEDARQVYCLNVEERHSFVAEGAVVHNCLGGEVQEILRHRSYEEAKEAALMYDDIFGRGSFFLELQDHGMEEQAEVNKGLIKISMETGIPLVVTNDCHYLDQSGAASHDVLMAVQAKTTIYDSKRKKYPTDQFYLKSPSEMWELFEYIPEALENTVKIADRCNVTIEFGKNKIPRYILPEGTSSIDFLRELVNKGILERYGEFTPENEERRDYELSVVEQMQYTDYFLIMWDLFNFARNQNIQTGPGRGSGAGSILLYSLYVTDIDPLARGLLFERFLDPSRISMPDVDSDFPDDRRQEVIDYIIGKYGRQSICQIITFSTMAARGAIRAVGRALDYPYSMCDKIAKMIPPEPKITIGKALKLNPDMRSLYDSNKEAERLINVSMDLEGLPLYTSCHAAGVLIVDEKGLTEHLPICKSSDGVITSQFEMGNLDELGLLKLDILGLRTLKVIANTIKLIKQNYDVDVDYYELYKCQDMAPLQIIRDGLTDGIFQLEGGGMTQFMKELKPSNIEEITAGISLYRPGPMEMIPRFLENRKNPDNIQYEFQELKPILAETYGVITYQEQTMQTVIALAGYQKHHSDGFRKAISKKKEDMVALHRTWFIDGREPDNRKKYDAIPGGIKLGRPRAKLEKVFGEMEDFAKYAFNKSHAAAYATLAYTTAWLKYYYPTEFMCALLNDAIKDKKKVSRYVNHAKSDLGIMIHAPSINASNESFVPLPDKTIIFSLMAKDTNKELLSELAQTRGSKNFVNMQDFFKRCSDVINKKTFKALVCVGAFDELGIIRSQYVAATETIFDKISKYKAALKRAEVAKKPRRIIFEEWIDLKALVPSTFEEFPEQPKLSLEKEYLGVYLSGHPLNRYKGIADMWSNFKLSDLDYEIDEESGNVIMAASVQDRQRVQIIVLMSDFLQTVTKAKQELMGIGTIEDLTGSTKLLIFPEMYARTKDILSVDEVYKVTGFLKVSSDETPCIICHQIEPIQNALLERVIIPVESEAEVNYLTNYIPNLMCKGKSPVYITYNNMQILLDSEYWVNAATFKEFGDQRLLQKCIFRTW